MTEPARSLRAVVALALAACIALLAGTPPGGLRSDFAPVLFGARALLDGRNPYALVGPGRALDFPWGLYYPMPAVWLALPLAPLPDRAAEATFAFISVALLAYAVTRDGWHRLPLFASGSLLGAVTLVQWTPLLTAGLLLPWVGALAFPAKPNVGAALWAARPSRRVALGGAAFALATVAVYPWWPASWLSVVREGRHLLPPVAVLPGGPLLLLAALRWRRADARLLLALALVPANVVVTDVLPLFLVARGWWQSAALAAASHAVIFLTRDVGPRATFEAYLDWTRPLVVGFLYLPVLVIILRRPNEATAGARAS